MDGEAAEIWYGDMNVTVTYPPMNNLIKGTTITDFLNKKTVNISLFDTETYGYLNTMMWGNYIAQNFKYKTNPLWYFDDSGSVSAALSYKLLESKFRLYRVARQKITMSNYRVNMNSQFRPLCLWSDSKQSDMLFILAENTYQCEADTHKLVLREYDNAETINLV